MSAAAAAGEQQGGAAARTPAAAPASTPSRGSSAAARKRKRKRPTANLDTNYDSVRAVAKACGFRVTKTDDRSCHLLWHDSCPPIEVFTALKPYQRLNHFPATGEICRKDSLARNLNRLQRLCPKEYNFFPRSWVLPADYGPLQEYTRQRRAKGKPARTLIYKPVNGARGMGIALTRDPSQLSSTEPLLVQEYLGSPCLVDGFKFDLRLYVLLASCDPLRVHLFNDGLVRLSTTAYHAPTAANIDKLYMHLTNYSVNKDSEEFEMSDDVDKGSKRSVRWLLGALREQGQDVDRMWLRVQDVIIKTLIAALPCQQHNYRLHTCGAHGPAAAKRHQSNCFEILGFDIFLDKKLRPFVIEVNRAPSFTCDTKLDEDIKYGVLTAAIRLANIKTSDRDHYEKGSRQAAQGRLFPGRKDPKAPDSPDVGRTTPKPSVFRHQETVVDHTAEEKLLIHESRHSGGFDLMYPCESTAKMAMYEELMRQSAVAYDTFVGQGKPSQKRKSVRVSRDFFSEAAPLPVIPTRLKAVVSTKELVQQRNLQRQSGVLERLRRSRLSMPGLSDFDTEILLAELRDNWVEHRSKVQEYWLRRLDHAKRARVLGLVRNNVDEIMRKAWGRRDVSSLKFSQLASRVFDKLLWNNGQGLWNTFCLPNTEWESLEPLLGLYNLSRDERLLCQLLASTCQDAVLVIYQTRTVLGEARSPSPAPCSMPRLDVRRPRPSQPSPKRRTAIKPHTLTFESITSLAPP